jgi:hypothetical protein
MKNHTNKQRFLRIPYEMLRIPDLTKSDLLALAYNQGEWDDGYYASSEHAAEVLSLNITTFRKSVTKLKKLGLWTYRGEVIKPRRYSPNREIKALDRALKAPMGELKAPMGELKAPVGALKALGGEYKNPILPMKNEVLLDSLLDNKLEKDKKEILENAAGAANFNSPSLSLSSSEDLKNNMVQTNLVSETFYNYDTSGSYNKESKNETRCDEPNLKLKAETGPLTKAQMIDANFDAVMRGATPPFSDDQVRQGATKPLGEEFADLFWDQETPCPDEL